MHTYWIDVLRDGRERLFLAAKMKIAPELTAIFGVDKKTVGLFKSKLSKFDITVPFNPF